ncbi:hypothetical protein [Flavobacterium luminosum]|uniref:DUF4369 domain-containing protein n=1 Tax=Flavobacterium luminosum TaxID=2949086 RepID=A0ABT0TLK8_9FLAO|nr:hypothetical protein [Flavobacterium sp. HXWNR70]MCL9807974.1 hypothetical protein [Flavobacterium sp. HXWNR70]
MNYKTTVLTVIYLFFFNLTSYSQIKKDTLYNWFDTQTGLVSLPLYNGSIHLNYDKTSENHHRYWILNEFQTGTVNYDNQVFNNLSIKYDILEDELILMPQNQDYKIAINTKKDLILYFILNQTKFVNLDHHKNKNSFLKGFYAEHFTSPKLSLYIKHYKKKRDLIKNDRILREYDYYQNFILEFKDNFFIIHSKKDVIRIFPDIKEKINAFYTSNTNLEKNNKIRFMEQLIQYINSITTKSLNGINE